MKCQKMVNSMEKNKKVKADDGAAGQRKERRSERVKMKQDRRAK